MPFDEMHHNKIVPIKTGCYLFIYFRDGYGDMDIASRQFKLRSSLWVGKKEREIDKVREREKEMIGLNT